MIASLADAWNWYETTRQLARTMKRFGEKHWNNLPWDGDLGRDDHLKRLTSERILNGTQMVLDDLDDLCVLLLFSVFEATIRVRVLAEVEAELPPPRHMVIKGAVDDMKKGALLTFARVVLVLNPKAQCGDVGHRARLRVPLLCCTKGPCFSASAEFFR